MWCWTRLTGCWTWDLSLRSGRSLDRSGQTDRLTVLEIPEILFKILDTDVHVVSYLAEGGEEVGRGLLGQVLYSLHHPQQLYCKVCLHHGWFLFLPIFNIFEPRTDFCHINIGSGELSANHDILQVAGVVQHLLGLKVQYCFFPAVLFLHHYIIFA